MSLATAPSLANFPVDPATVRGAYAEVATGSVSHVRLHNVARRKLAEGKSPEEVFGLLLESDKKLNKPPLGPGEADAVLQLAVSELRGPQSVWESISLTDARRDTTTGPPWVIKGLLAKDSANLVSALPHSMKSLTWLAACMQAVNSGRVWNHFDAPNVKRAIFFETEDPPWLLKARMRGLAKGLGLKAAEELEGFKAVWTGPFDLVNGGATQLQRAIEEHQADLCIFSTLQNTLAGRNWKEASEMQPVPAAFMHLARIAPIVVLTHSPWDQRQTRAAGSVTQTANYMFATHYKKIPPDRVQVTVDSKIGSETGEFILRLNLGGNADDASAVRDVVFDRMGRARGSNKQEVEEALAADPKASARELAERLNIPERTVRYAIQKRREGAETSAEKGLPLARRHRRRK